MESEKTCGTCSNAKAVGGELYCYRDIGRPYSRILVRTDWSDTCKRWNPKENRKD